MATVLYEARIQIWRVTHESRTSFPDPGVAVAAVKERKTIRRFYFVACGGSQASMMPIQYMFDRETSIPSAIYTSNEFVKGNTEGAGRYLALY